MIKRLRSPNCPGFSLGEAVIKIRKLHDEIGQAATSREVVAKSMGYSGLSGSSATAISALNKYGLLEGRGDDVKLSQRAVTILFGELGEKRAAMKAAAFEPPLFRELAERFQADVRSEEPIRNYLMRSKFASQAVDGVITAYKETMELVRDLEGGDDSGGKQPQERPRMQPTSPEMAEAQAQPSTTGAPPRELSAKAGKFRVSMDDEFRIDIVATGLDRQGVARLIKWLEANKNLPPEAPRVGQQEGGDDDDDEEKI